MTNPDNQNDESYHINIQEWGSECPNLSNPKRLYVGQSRKRKNHLYDEDYVYDEYEYLEVKPVNPDRRTERAISQIVTQGTTHNVKKYVQYFILYKMVTDPKYKIHYDSRVNKKDEDDLLEELKALIKKIFHKESHPGLEDNKYLKTILKNKRGLLTCVIKKIIHDHPSVYEHDDLILRYTLNYPGIRPLYQKRYYLSAKKEYEDIYKEIYPINRIGEKYYYQLIHEVKQHVNVLKKPVET